jgi:hypothetical protein
MVGWLYFWRSFETAVRFVSKKFQLNNGLQHCQALRKDSFVGLFPENVHFPSGANPTGKAGGTCIQSPHRFYRAMYFGMLAG